MSNNENSNSKSTAPQRRAGRARMRALTADQRRDLAAMGGHARTLATTPEQRSAWARKGARVRAEKFALLRRIRAAVVAGAP